MRRSSDRVGGRAGGKGERNSQSDIHTRTHGTYFFNSLFFAKDFPIPYFQFVTQAIVLLLHGCHFILESLDGSGGV